MAERGEEPAETEEDAVYVVDGFLRDPHALRRLGLEADYVTMPTTQTYAGRNSRDPYPVAGMDAAIARITGQSVVALDLPASHARFRLCLAGETGSGGVHVDNCHWTGVLYMTLDEHAQGGTDFFRHRQTDTLRAPVYPEDWAAWGGRDVDRMWKEVVVPQTNDPARWDLVRHVGMKFNRLVLFRPWLWHNATPGFGDEAQNGRLIYTVFYNETRWS
jgi:hypothetical protein